MYTLAIVLHLIACVIMIASILLQSGKGAEIGAAFGGSSQTVFGSRGPGTFLSKITVGAAVIFMLTSLSLAVLSRQAQTSSTVIDLHPTTHQESSSSSPDSPSTGTTESTETTAPAETPSETSTEPADEPATEPTAESKP